ncbi:MAG: motility protein MotB [Pseudomonadales bacterium]|nr:motility protein MotB [Pseudomonadales bacterium]
MEFESGDKPVIVRRVRKSRSAPHGGAWKVAFADFATAMMAFFLVLWLLEATSVEEKAAISGYFSDPSGFTEGGSPYVIDLGGGLRDDQSADQAGSETDAPPVPDAVLTEETVQDLAAQIESRRFQELKKNLETRIENDPNLSKYRDQIIMEVTRDGLQIQIVDASSRPMFDSGSDDIKPYMNEILQALADTIAAVPNGLSITGHTDAEAFTERSDYSNWELSADRANAARRALLRNGVSEQQISQVVGLADSALYDKEHPDNPINRRISILVLSEQSQAQLQQQQQRAALPVDPEFPAPEADPGNDREAREAFDSFERLRKTMTRKQRDAGSQTLAPERQDEVF